MVRSNSQHFYDPSYSSRDIQNSMVMASLIHSMEDNLAEVYIIYPTAKAIWDDVNLAYSNIEDTSLMFDLLTRVTSYFIMLTKIWQELDLFNQQNWHDPAENELYHKMLSKECHMYPV